MTNEISITPRLICKDADAAIQFYVEVFGAVEGVRYETPDGIIVHSELSLGRAVLAVVDAAPDWQNVDPTALGGSAVILHLLCEDPDATANLAVLNGGEIVFPIEDQSYGHREGRIRDPFGHLWIVGRVKRKMSYEEIQKSVDDFAS